MIREEIKENGGRASEGRGSRSEGRLTKGSNEKLVGIRGEEVMGTQSRRSRRNEGRASKIMWTSRGGDVEEGVC